MTPREVYVIAIACVVGSGACELRELLGRPHVEFAAHDFADLAAQLAICDGWASGEALSRAIGVGWAPGPAAPHPIDALRELASGATRVTIERVTSLSPRERLLASLAVLAPRRTGALESTIAAALERGELAAADVSDLAEIVGRICGSAPRDRVILATSEPAPRN